MECLTCITVNEETITLRRLSVIPNVHDFFGEAVRFSLLSRGHSSNHEVNQNADFWHDVSGVKKYSEKGEKRFNWGFSNLQIMIGRNFPFQKEVQQWLFASQLFKVHWYHRAPQLTLWRLLDVHLLCTSFFQESQCANKAAWLKGPAGRKPTACL